MEDFLLDKCIFKPIKECLLDQKAFFDCGHTDLNDFFGNEAYKYSIQLLGKTYCFVLQENPDIIVCAFTVSNDGIDVNHVPNNRKKKINKDIPREKQMRRYPAVLIGRLGVNKDFKKMHIGTSLMNFIKSWFIDDNNKTGCRFLAVDAYNEPIPLSYYDKNEFKYIFSTEEQEKDALGIPMDKPLSTRLMYFDLILLKN